MPNGFIFITVCYGHFLIKRDKPCEYYAKIPQAIVAILWYFSTIPKTKEQMCVIPLKEKDGKFRYRNAFSITSHPGIG